MSASSSSSNGYQIRLELLKLALDSIVKEHEILLKYEELYKDSAPSDNEDTSSDFDDYDEFSDFEEDEDDLTDESNEMEDSNLPTKEEKTFVDDILERAHKFNVFVSSKCTNQQ